MSNGAVIPVYCDYVVDDGIISEIKPKNYNQYSDPVGSEIDLQRRVVTIPHVNFHEHFYSRLAKGLSIKKPTANFQQILENLWWKIDKIIDRDILEASVELGALESIRNGVLYVIDHHSSPSFVNGSLELINSVLKKYSIRNVLCFETSDRDGESIKSDSLNEQKIYSKSLDENSKILLGLHASFTIHDDTLKSAKKIIDEIGTGIHIHLCEDESDVLITLKMSGLSPVQRLQQFGLLNSKSILAHGIHLSDNELKIIEKSGAAIAYNLHSNLNNSVGLPDFRANADIPILIGTDGMHANIASSQKSLFLMMRSSGLSFEQTFKKYSSSYHNQIEFISQFFPGFSKLNEGENADFIIWDYVPPTPFNVDNFFGHYIYGILESQIRSVVSKGVFIMKDFILPFDTSDLRDKIYIQGKRLFQKFNELQ
ncbi:MAG: amidohydrolase family protein [Melioribacteraceae bacterium]|nr:amidohydrolase family protein [Melioribacteraceae bacterium]